MFASFFDKFKQRASEKIHLDPVCGMSASDGIMYGYKGITYEFCSDPCKTQFEKEPERFVKTKKSAGCCG